MLRILMYHALVSRHEPYMARVHVEAARFEKQMAWLAASGLPVRPLAEALAALPAGRPAVALTFDDGYRSQLRVAAPVLARLGLPATLFVTTDAVGQFDYAGQPGFAASAPLADPPLTWVELRQLQALGWAIEAHGCSHRSLAARPLAEQVAELAGSRAAVATHLGRAPELFAYPYGSYDRRTLAALGPAGYRAACATHTGLATAAHDPRRLPRLEITAGLDLPAFRQLVITGYASPAVRRRAWLRDHLYRWPALKDALRGLGSGQ